jgi:hypothetical protein
MVRSLCTFVTVVALSGAACSESGAHASAADKPEDADAAAALPSTAPTSIDPPLPPGPQPLLLGAIFDDRDHSGRASAGDEVSLRFDRAVVLSGADPNRDLDLSPGDTFGSGATIAAGATADEVIVHLGAGATLALAATYLPGRAPGPGNTPARAALGKNRRLDTIVGSLGPAAPDGTTIPILWRDPDAAPSEVSRLVTAPAVAAAHPYFGNLHAHTGFSDGQLDPQQAQAHARGVGLDFMATSDHLEQIDATEWDTTFQMAAAEARPGTYATLVGFEWGHGYLPPLGWYNHVNIIGTTKLLPLVATDKLAGLYKEAQATSLPEGAIAIFNHPYISKPPLVYNMWDDFAYDGGMDRMIALIDCEGHGSPQTPELGFLPALAKGWHLAPSSNQDNHQPDWGDKNDRRAGVWLEALDSPGILRAVREGRAFSTSDKNGHIKLVANGTLWMGSTIAAPGPVTLRVEVGDADGEAFDKIELWSNGAVVESKPLAGQSFVELTVDPAADAYFFARAYQADGDELFSAPIYVDR